ncbi:MAG: hypothetical protein R8K49_06700 [Mariprofundaceae bacterium]
MTEHQASTAFVWYHGLNEHEHAYKDCLELIKQQFDIQAEFYKRTQTEQTTFMEVFKHIDSSTMQKIEQLAAQQDCFNNIDRRCESFKRISTT